MLAFTTDPEFLFDRAMPVKEVVDSSSEDDDDDEEKEKGEKGVLVETCPIKRLEKIVESVTAPGCFACGGDLPTFPLPGTSNPILL